MDKNEIAALLESLCDRPFADDPGRSPAMQDMAKRGALGLSHADTQQGVPSDAPDDPGRATAELAAILSDTATDAQRREFQQAASTSGAVRLDAQSALAFVDGIEQAPVSAPAHLLEQVLGSVGARALGASDAQRKPGVWSRVSGIRLGVGRARMVAACTLLIMAGGLSWSLLLPPANSPQSRMPLPAVTNPGGAPLSNLDPAQPAPVSAQYLLPGRLPCQAQLRTEFSPVVGSDAGARSSACGSVRAAQPRAIRNRNPIRNRQARPEPTAEKDRGGIGARSRLCRCEPARGDDPRRRAGGRQCRDRRRPHPAGCPAGVAVRRERLARGSPVEPALRSAGRASRIARQAVAGDPAALKPIRGVIARAGGRPSTPCRLLGHDSSSSRLHRGYWVPGLRGA